MDKLKIEAFLTAAEGGSLTHAAKLLGYTQPGITRMINSLEDELGFPLLLRTKKGVALTPNGKEMLPMFRDVLRALRRVEETSAQITGYLSGVLTIGCYYSVSSILLPGILKRFLDDYPGIKIDVREASIAELGKMLQDRSLDMCFSAKPSTEGAFDWIPFIEDELVAWVPLDNPYAKEESFPISRLNDFPFILTLPQEETEIDMLLEEIGGHSNVRFTTKDPFTTYQMVSRGLGISLNQRISALEWKGNVAMVPFDPPQFLPIGIAVSSLENASPAAKKFIEYVMSEKRSAESSGRI